MSSPLFDALEQTPTVTINLSHRVDEFNSVIKSTALPIITPGAPTNRASIAILALLCGPFAQQIPPEPYRKFLESVSEIQTWAYKEMCCTPEAAKLAATLMHTGLK